MCGRVWSSSVVGETEVAEEPSEWAAEDGDVEPDLGLSATTGEAMLLRKSR